MSEINQDQQSQLKKLIARGKDQGYLTFAEVKDSLPQVIDAERVEDIIGMISDMGITVYEESPDDETLLLAETPNDEVIDTVLAMDTELGRTTDPVRMYMREMGTVELLTRQGEIVIAKRIEEGLREVMAAFATYPVLVDFFLAQYQRVEAGELRIVDLLLGFYDLEAEADEAEIAEQAKAKAAAAAQPNKSEEDEDDADEQIDTAVICLSAGQLPDGAFDVCYL